MSQVVSETVLWEWETAEGIRYVDDGPVLIGLLLLLRY